VVDIIRRLPEVNAVRRILRKLIDRAAASYVAGDDVSDAIDFARAVEREGMSSTIAYWNSVGEDPAHVYSAYVSAIDAAADARIRTAVAIKAPALAMSASYAEALAVRCRERGIGLHFDSLAVEHQNQIFGLIERVIPSGVSLGCTLPGRFAQSLDDADRAIAHRLRVRVCKGQWEDPQHPIEPRRGFMALIDRLAGRAAHVAVATHEPRLVEEALTTLLKHGTSAELELLFGLPVHGAREVAQRLNAPVRMYVPYGYAWLPYALSAVRTNPSVWRWIVKDMVRGRTLRAGRRL
jgi:proline dehydrogenase